jgi:hypothetical protein
LQQINSMAKFEEQSPAAESRLTGVQEPALDNFANLRTPTALDINSGKTESFSAAQRTLDGQFGAAPVLSNDSAGEEIDHRVFDRRQEIQQRPGESSEDLHERLRPTAIAGFESVRHPTQIDTPSWYTFDASKTLGIKDAVAIITSTCKHELPYKVFVGIRGSDWDTSGRLPSGEQGHRYKLRDLGRDLTEQEKNAIYDSM